MKSSSVSQRRRRWPNCRKANTVCTLEYRVGVTNWETRGTSIWPEAYQLVYVHYGILFSFSILYVRHVLIFITPKFRNSRPFCDQDRKCINRRCICLYHYYCTVLEVPVRRVWKRKLEHENFRKNGETEIMWPRSGLRNLFVSGWFLTSDFYDETRK